MRNHVQGNNPNDKFKLICYHKISSRSSLFSRNYLSPSNTDLQKTNLVYEFHRNNSGCEDFKCYCAEVTKATLPMRLATHKDSGKSKTH